MHEMFVCKELQTREVKDPRSSVSPMCERAVLSVFGVQAVQIPLGPNQHTRGYIPEDLGLGRMIRAGVGWA